MTIAYPSSFSLKLTISRESWKDLLVADNVVVLNSVIATARQTLDNAGEFVIEGDPRVPEPDESFNGRPKFDQFIAGLNSARAQRGQVALG